MMQNRAHERSLSQLSRKGISYIIQIIQGVAQEVIGQIKKLANSRSEKFVIPQTKGRHLCAMLLSWYFCLCLGQ